jgi:hypothetical protein
MLLLGYSNAYADVCLPCMQCVWSDMLHTRSIFALPELLVDALETIEEAQESHNTKTRV